MIIPTRTVKIDIFIQEATPKAQHKTPRRCPVEKPPLVCYQHFPHGHEFYGVTWETLAKVGDFARWVAFLEDFRTGHLRKPVEYKAVVPVDVFKGNSVDGSQLQRDNDYDIYD